MALISGTRLGPYEIHSPLGAGGMGEVYRARDTRLERTVAIKILPAHFSSDPVRRQRFEREAKIISILNHPHICVVHDIGHQDGIDYLVMECIEGETLTKRLEKGPLPLDQVVKIGAEVADALDRAHRSGIVHRDLKPGNIMLTATGAKLLDFGLAKPAMALANAATLTGSALKADTPVTEQGTIVGTFQYMSPEQVEGKEVDGRSDIFSLGAVLYEMVTGKRAFAGKSRLSVASAILEREPEPISAIKPMTPPGLDHVILRCLAKNPEERWQSAADLRAEIKWAGTPGEPAAAAARKFSTWLASLLATVFGVVALIGIVGWWKGASNPEAVMRISVLPPAGSTLDLVGRNGAPALSPDGSSIAFVAVKDDKPFIWLRRLDSLEATQIRGTEGGYFPFWSPDGRYLAFFADGKLKKLPAEGGSPQIICGAEDARGGSWGKSGDIIFAPNRFSGLFRVSASGGQPVEVTKNNDFPNGGTHRWPFFLPDGRHFLYLSAPVGSEDEISAIHFASLDGSDNRVVINASSNPVFGSGYLLYAAHGTLYAAPFNTRRGVLSGEGQPVADSMLYDRLYSRGIFSASENGILVYRQGTAPNARLTWMDRKGKELAYLGEPAAYGGVRLSPDASRGAVSLTTANGVETWVFDTKRGTRTLLTYGPPLGDVVWAPDGKWLYFAKWASHAGGIYRKAADGSGQEEQLLASEVRRFVPTGISPDGKYLAFHFSSPNTKLDIWILPLQGEHKPFPYLETPFDEMNAQFSPDGRWMAYQSDETGKAEIYVARFPDPTGRIQISTTGAAQPVWSRDGTKLYFLTSTNDLMETDIAWHLGNPIVGAPHKLFNAHAKNNPTSMFDVASDGRFLVVSSGSESAEPITLVTNWTAGLKK